MKGFLKGLRYISQIFENEKEEEMQIGLPTDVKHVAHIGNDGSSSSNNPSWMNEFKASSKSASKGSPSRGKMKQSGSSSPSAIQKPRRQKNSNSESASRKSSSKDPNGSMKPSRKKKKGASASEGSTPRARKITDIHTTSDISRK